MILTAICPNVESVIVLKTMLFTTLLALTALPLQARVLDCAIKTGASQNGFITDRYIFEIDEAAGKATGLDGAIQEINGGPIEAKLSANDKKLGVSWSLKMTTTTGKSIRMMYRASYVKASNAVQISVQPGGGEYSGGFEARGSCK
jgi:hypothetical protein